MVGDILGIGGARMRDGDAARVGEVQVDAVIAHGEAGDQPQARHRVDQRGAERKFARPDQRVDAGERRRIGPVPQGEHVIVGAQHGQQRRQQRLPHQQ